MVMSMFDQLAGALDGRAGLILAAFSLASVAFAVAVDSSKASPRVIEFTLGNGLHVLVIPDHRAPVVTQMIWYKVGAADEPRGSSGIAHFLEHLMFKGTEAIPPGQFSKIVARNGGEDNAFTNHDVTAYFQRVAKDRLPTVMAMEADRMANLRLSEEDVATERNVILEERRSRVDNDPSSILQEQMMSALYANHPMASRSSAGRTRLPRSTARMRSDSTGASMPRTTRCWSSPAMSSPTRCGSSPRRLSAGSRRMPRSTAGRARRSPIITRR